jgi:hypothetical protein
VTPERRGIFREGLAVEQDIKNNTGIEQDRHWFRLIPMSPLSSFDLFFGGEQSIAYFTFKVGKSF